MNLFKKNNNSPSPANSPETNNLPECKCLGGIEKQNNCGFHFLDNFKWCYSNKCKNSEQETDTGKHWYRCENELPDCECINDNKFKENQCGKHGEDYAWCNSKKLCKGAFSNSLLNADGTKSYWHKCTDFKDEEEELDTWDDEFSKGENKIKHISSDKTIDDNNVDNNVDAA